MKSADLPMFAGINAPCPVETDVAGLEVDDGIPRKIDGAFCRVAADHRFPPRFANDVPFSGGMISMFRTCPVVEPCFIPRQADAPEGDGWITQALTNSQAMRTAVKLFVASEIARGPIATVKLPLRLKLAYHGSWSEAQYGRFCGLR